MEFPVLYIERKPPRDLSHWIACLCRIAGNSAHGSPISHRILPDGCADLLFVITDGRAIVSEAPGSGTRWNSEAVVGMSRGRDLLCSCSQGANARKVIWTVPRIMPLA